MNKIGNHKFYVVVASVTIHAKLTLLYHCSKA